MRRIARDLIEDNPRAAHAIVDDLEAKAFEIASFPKRYILVREYLGIELRRRVVGRYLIFYKAGADRIEIVHFLHGARDISRALRRWKT